MKKLICLLAFGLVLTACSVNEEQTYSYEITPISTVTMAIKYATDSISVIKVKYLKPSSCHLFNGFYYQKDVFNRTVAVETLRVNQDNCQTDGVTIVQKELKFTPIAVGTYHFKFFTGTDTAGVDQFLEYDALVDH
ncbi:MAG: hypothetical protein H7239_00415 [Flavobacterium sp.]|nr:hypothetical protein [Flavobacterium sp.]